jgi:hypothetical protein
MTIVLLDKTVLLQESGIPQWLSWLPRDGGYRSALWKRLNDYINRYDQFVSTAQHSTNAHKLL